MTTSAYINFNIAEPFGFDVPLSEDLGRQKFLLLLLLLLSFTFNQKVYYNIMGPILM